MATQSHEFQAKSVDEAIEAGLQTLGVARSEVDIEVVNKGSRGLFGIGSEPAVVRLILRSATATNDDENSIESADNISTTVETTAAAEPTVQSTEVASVASAQPVAAEETAIGNSDNATADDELETSLTEDDSNDYEEDDDESDDDVDYDSEDGDITDDELADLAADLLDEMIHLMGFDAEISSSWEDEDDFEDEDPKYRRYLLLDVEGTDLGALIGRRGETLDNIQYLLRLMVNQKIHQWKNIVVDVEHYKSRRVSQVTQLAERMAEQVARTGKAISLEPMPANERRIVHMVLRSHPEVHTESYGEGSRRKVHIFASD